MKYIWKIFFAVMLTSLFFLTLGCFALIETGFTVSYQRGEESALQMSDLLYYSLKQRSHEAVSVADPSVKVNENTLFSYYAKSAGFEQTERGVEFRILDEKQREIFSNYRLDPEKKWKEELPADSMVCFADQAGKRKVLRVLRPISFWGEAYYLENLWDITDIYRNKEQQYYLFLQIAAGLVLFGGIAAALVAFILIRPLKRLNSAAADIGSGNLKMRIPVKGNDEIAQLSKQFNQMAQSLELKMKTIEEEGKNKELFVASFSHELKTPLTAIIGFSQRILGRVKGDADLTLSAGYIYEEGRRLEQLSMRLLDLIVLEQKQPELEPVSASVFFEHVAALVNIRLQESGVLLETEITDGRIWMDPTLMETVCVNLIDNARKATEKGGTVRLTGSPVKLGYEFSVADNGIGMEPEEFEKVKRAFYMGDKSRSRKEGGAGLGLAICEKILKLHQAELEISSEPGVGTCVKVLLREDAGGWDEDF